MRSVRDPIALSRVEVSRNLQLVGVVLDPQQLEAQSVCEAGELQQPVRVLGLRLQEVAELDRALVVRHGSQAMGGR